MVYTFKKPYEFEGKTYESIEFDLDNLKGSDVAAAKKAFTAAGGFAPVPAADSEFCALVLERVVSPKQPTEFFQGLPANEYVKLTQIISNFLLG